MSTLPDIKQHITTDPAICGGRPCIAGTRIRVHDIYVLHELQGQSPDQIVHDFPQLTLADVYAALAYFWDNREAMLAQIEQDRQFIEQMKRTTPSRIPDKLRAAGDHAPTLPS